MSCHPWKGIFKNLCLFSCLIQYVNNKIQYFPPLISHLTSGQKYTILNNNSHFARRIDTFQSQGRSLILILRKSFV
ncbi:hypothetical protein KUTeg_020784 [Tegillarca granosa]|uniref:Uncharacterized protein n=1 Tax=Tegillarca granosa TaxID=220873 RepID=A0ABQ9EE23_TEGGR|nr:hypothetical protein KUTeg_020784 [Tegillarca granosa]